ncbi:UDP-N-acetylglucosamine 2-epimerase [Azonexus hydrophilus]|jgi:UDP-N-acetylglucosamine 2-epimerase (hydrolysing)|uniref:UDP-N-acetylglucosamine 2-epimerase n=1 Tax=Azonexus hydrophilus TaxID=418702 RepID=A0ABZ2XF27_9RHOO|nr:UDP-N-acetylglucosamine 2-epimerase (hydrolyzing) [Dechloromonas sp.]
MSSLQRRKIIFLTGTRADFGKLKSLMLRLQADEHFEVHVFITGMHMLSKYGSTWDEVRKAGLLNLYRFINQNENDSMDQVLAKTVAGLSDYVKEMLPEMIVVHGDRIEALAGALVGALNNIRVAHIEGGEVSGTIDEVIRHSISKMSHLHFVANEQARKRLVQLGERSETIHVIGSPDVDVMNSANLPSLEEVRGYYGFDFGEYAILMFHPVTTEIKLIRQQVAVLVDSILETGQNFVVLYPNNDHGTDIILNEYTRLRNSNRIAIYPSMRFEYFLTLLKHAQYIIGNSSAGIREAPHFGVPTINLGSRQHKRVQTPSVMEVMITKRDILDAIARVPSIPRTPRTLFGDGNSALAFHQILRDIATWDRDIQKYFVDCM